MTTEALETYSDTFGEKEMLRIHIRMIMITSLKEAEKSPRALEKDTVCSAKESKPVERIERYQPRIPNMIQNSEKRRKKSQKREKQNMYVFMQNSSKDLKYHGPIKNGIGHTYGRLHGDE